VLDLPILRLTGDKSLIGLLCIGSRNLYVIDVDDTLILVNWVDVTSCKAVSSHLVLFDKFDSTVSR